MFPAHASSSRESRTRALAAAFPRMGEEMARISRLFVAGQRDEALAQFFALAGTAIRTQRQDVDCRGAVVLGRTAEIGLLRIPAVPRPGRPVALFLPGLMSALPLAAARALAFLDLFDIVICELPGHGATGQTDDVSVAAFAAEYAALIDTSFPNASGLTIIGESLGGLIALALARSRPQRIRNVILIDTPFLLVRPDLAACIGAAWRMSGQRDYVRRICLEIMGFDPADDRVIRTAALYDMVRDAPFACVHIIGGDRPSVSGPASVVSDDDILALRAANPAMPVTPRIAGTGHSVLADDPDGARMALDRFIVREA